MAKKLIQFYIDEDNEEFVEEQVTDLNTSRAAVLNGMIKLVREQADSIGFQFFFTNGYKVRDGRYRDGVRD